MTFQLALLANSSLLSFLVGNYIGDALSDESDIEDQQQALPPQAGPSRQAYDDDTRLDGLEEDGQMDVDGEFQDCWAAVQYALQSSTIITRQK